MSNKNTTFVWISIIILLGGGAGFYFLTKKQPKKAPITLIPVKEEEPTPTKPEKPKVDKDEIEFQKIQQKVITLEADKQYYEAMSLLDDFCSHSNNIACKSKAKKLIKKLRGQRNNVIKDIMSSLENKSAELSDKYEFTKIYTLLEQYDGPYAKHTLNQRKELIARYKKEEKKYLKKKEFLLDAVAENILNSNFKEACTIFKSNKTFLKDDGELLSPRLKQLCSIEKLLINHYKQKIGKDISVYINNKKYQGSLKDITDDKLVIFQSIGKLKIKKELPIKDISTKSRIKILKENLDSDTFALYAVSIGAKLKNFKITDKYISSTGILQQPLTEKINQLKEEAASEETAKAAEAKEEENKKKTLQEKKSAYIPPIMAAYKLLHYFYTGNSTKLLGKTVIVTGMVGKVVNAKEGKRIDMYVGKLSCYSKTPDDAKFQALSDFYEAALKEYINKPSDYRDYLIKATIKGTVARGEKPSSLVLKDASIIAWYGVKVRLPGVRAKLEFIISNTPSLLKKTRRKKPSSYTRTVYRKPNNYPTLPEFCSSSPESRTTFNEYVWQSKEFSSTGFGLIMGKKRFKFAMGNDPYSLATEIHKINTIINKKITRRNFIIEVMADKQNEGLKLNNHTSVISWKVTNPETIHLYPIHTGNRTQVILDHPIIGTSEWDEYINQYSSGN